MRSHGVPNYTDPGGDPNKNIDFSMSGQGFGNLGLHFKTRFIKTIRPPHFGQGVIELSEPGKITVFFATGRRVLAQAKEASAAGGLSRPKPFDHTSPSPGGKRSISARISVAMCFGSLPSSCPN